MIPPAATFGESSLRPRRTKLSRNRPTCRLNSFWSLKRPKPALETIRMRAPTPMARNSCSAASEPFWPALWISLAATDSGNCSDESSTMTRRRIVTNMIPSSPPRIISDDDTRYSCHMFAESNFQRLRMTNAGIVKIAPAATDSPIEPTVRAKFSSRIVLSLNSRSTAIPMTAAG